MTFEEFRRSQQGSEAPTGLPAALVALWWDGKGDWNKAHQYAQDDNSRPGSWVHAYLHRKEGDLGNAAYWYARTGKKAESGSLESEWENLVRSLLELKT